MGRMLPVVCPLSLTQHFANDRQWKSSPWYFARTGRQGEEDGHNRDLSNCERVGFVGFPPPL
jgi:hypothetical protein